MSKSQTAYDALTFSRDFIDKIDELLDVFNIITKDQLFSGILETKNASSMYDTLPHWFSKAGLNTIGEWIVSHFETRILHL